jgi:hypothetical protein
VSKPEKGPLGASPRRRVGLFATDARKVSVFSAELSVGFIVRKGTV